MPNDKQLEAAVNTYRSLTEFFDRNNFHYDRYPDDLMIITGAKLEDHPMTFAFKVLPKNNELMLYSPLPFVIPDGFQIEMANAICIVNNFLNNGYFQFDQALRLIIFCLMDHYYIDSPLSDKEFDYMVRYSLHVIDDYNDTFESLASGKISFEQFMDKIDGGKKHDRI